MKKIHIKISILALFVSTVVLAGNDDKRGQAGATELLMNPWTRSSGWLGGSIAGIRGPEAMRFNVAGIAETNSTDLVFSQMNWYAGSQIKSSALGFTQKVGNGDGVIGLSLMSLNFGEFIETTTNLPEGTGQTFKPSFFNLGVAYSRKFSNRINGGILIRVVNESVANVSASGIAIDAGIQYKGGEDDRFKFGVSLRNIGDKMRYSGDGLAYRSTITTSSNQITHTMQERAAEYELPSLLNIAVSYDVMYTKLYVLTLGGNFNSNSFTNDRLQFGYQFAFKEMFFARLGYDYYNGRFNGERSETDIHSGLSAGFGVEAPISKTVDKNGKDKIQSKIGFDYSFRATKVLGGTHGLSVTMTL